MWLRSLFKDHFTTPSVTPCFAFILFSRSFMFGIQQEKSRLWEEWPLGIRASTLWFPIQLKQLTYNPTWLKQWIRSMRTPRIYIFEIKSVQVRIPPTLVFGDLLYPMKMSSLDTTGLHSILFHSHWNCMLHLNEIHFVWASGCVLYSSAKEDILIPDTQSFPFRYWPRQH